MNAIAFYILALLIVAAAAAVVILPNMRDAAAALLAASLFIAVLCAATGAFIVAVAQLLVPAAGIAAVVLLVRRGAYRGVVGPSPLLPRSWWIGAAVALGFAALLVTVFAFSSDGWFRGLGDSSLLTVLHYREPYALVVAVILAGAAVAIAFMLGRTGEDERETDAMLAARRHRDERMRLRREARESARRARREAPAARGRA